MIVFPHKRFKSMSFMNSHYFVVAARNVKKYWLFSLINIIGLSIGIASALAILLFIVDELSYDKYFANKESLFRVIQDDEEGEGSSLPFPVTTTLQHEFPDLVKTQTRLFNFQASTLAITYESPEDKKAFNEPHFFFADSTFFDVFGFRLIEGDKQAALYGPGKVVLTESTARRYFGTAPAVGKTLKFEGKYDLLITGVMADIPRNTHFKMDFVASFHSLNHLFEKGIPEMNWYWNPVWGYVVLNDPAQKELLGSQLKSFADKYYHPSLKGKVSLALQPIDRIYLHSKSAYEIAPMSDVKYSEIFSLAAIAILIMACINFVNLSTAQSAQRFKEIGVRKIAGASRTAVAFQFFAESFIVVLLSALLAVLTVVVALPWLNNLTGKSLNLADVAQPAVITAYIGIVVIVAVCAGAYPSIVLSRKQILVTLKPGLPGSSSWPWLRSSLVVLQFFLAIVFISGTLIVFGQIQFMRDKKLGFHSEEIIVLPVQRLSVVPKYETFKERLLTYPGIVSVSAVNTIPGREFQSSNYKKQGDADDELTLKPCLYVRNDFAKTMGISMVAGEEFSDDITSTGFHAIINRTMATEYGWSNPEDAIGQVLVGTLEGPITVKGVVENFHFAPLTAEIGPLIIVRGDKTQWDEFFTNYIMIRFRGDIESCLAFLNKEWTTMVAESPFDFFFLNDRLQQNYVSETRFNSVVTVFSMVSIVISMLGLLGLASFTIARRLKEVSIRKVLGASVSTLLVLLAKDFIKLILIAAVLAVPASLFLSRKWLSSFAYKIDIAPAYFIISILAVVVIAAMTIAFIVTRASRVNPAVTLRNE